MTPPPVDSPSNDVTRLPRAVAASGGDAVTGAGLSRDVEVAGAAATNVPGADMRQAQSGSSRGGILGTNVGSGAPRSAVSAPLGVGQSFGPRYHIIRLLGAGGMGAVYQAWDDELGVAVAIKVIRPEITADPTAAEQMERRFKRELLLARQVTHKNVVRIHDLGEIDGIKYITMPYVQGASLETILRREGRLSPARALQIAKHVVAGLAAAHEVGVIHRDLKPANVMIDAEENALITDFGIARSLSAATALTKAAGIVGTLEFMAPEQARGEAVDQRADIYAFGLMFRDMLAGRRQATGENVVAELMERMQRAPAPVRAHVPEVPEPLEAIVDRCLQPNPADRFQTTRDLAKALDALDDDGWPRVGSGIHTRTRRVKWSAAAAIVVLLALAGAAVPMRNRLPWMRTKSSAAVGQPVTLAILPFRNASGDQTLDWLGASLVEMLGTDIGQSAQLHIVSSSRLQEILRDLRIAPDATFDPAALRRLADFSSAETVLWGQYLKFGNEIRLDATLEDLRRQTHLNLKAEAPTEKGLLGAVAQLAGDVRANLALAPDAIKELQASARKPSSASVQALRYFNEGLQLARQGKHADALKGFEAATREDSEFALAYSKLGQEYATLGYDDKAEQSSRHAVELSESLPPSERYVILANHAKALHDTKKAIEAYENLVKASPEDSNVHFELAGLYESSGSFDRALEHYQKVVAADPKYVDGLTAVGRVLIRQRNPQASLEYLNRGLSLSIQLENDEAKATILQAIGVAYKRLNKSDDALRYYQESLAIKRRLGQKRGMAVSLNEIAQVQLSLGKLDEALASFTEALRLRREIGDKKGIGDTLIDLGGFYQGRGQYDDALKLIKESLQIQREVGNQNYEALCLNNIGNVYLAKSQYEDALTYFDRALQLREKLKISSDIAETLHNLAETSSKTGQYEQALAYYLRAIELRRSAGDKRNVAIESHSMGTIFDYQGRYGAAVSAHEEAVKTFRELQERGFWLAAVLGGYGDALNQIGRVEDARKNLEEALRVARDLSNSVLVAQMLNFQADGFFYQGDFKSARALYEQALQVASRTTDRHLILLSKVNLAKVAVKERRPQAAIPVLKPLAEEADSRGLAYLSVECAISRGEALLIVKDYAQARQELERVLGKSEKMGLQTALAKTHYLLGTVLRLSGSPADASRHYAEARRILDAVRKEARLNELGTRADLSPIYAEPAR
jgi:tetratricopeptide (TPR) repeat protein/tRNA A-37 threonylcarbamoyl transferase component Bud32